MSVFTTTGLEDTGELTTGLEDTVDFTTGELTGLEDTGELTTLGLERAGELDATTVLLADEVDTAGELVTTELGAAELDNVDLTSTGTPEDGNTPTTLEGDILPAAKFGEDKGVNTLFEGLELKFTG